MKRSFKELIATAESLSDDFTEVTGFIDRVCWELESTLSAVRKDACGYRTGRHNSANPDGGANYVPGELERAVEKAFELKDALKGVYGLVGKERNPLRLAINGLPARFEIDFTKGGKS